MRIYPEKLAQELQRQLMRVYLVSGDEPLLVQECCDLIRQRAREEGCTEREVVDVVGAHFDWQVILHSASSMSLFAERKLLEIRLPSGKPGADGSKALCEYLELASPDDVLLIVAGKIDKQSTNSKWYKALDKAGGTLQIWPIKPPELPRWLQQRVQAAGMRIDNDALQLLCERVEGNLLAAVQEVEKLKLLASDNQITVQTVTESVSNNARYDLFGMADSALGGDARNSLRMLHGLRGEGTEPPVALWALLREIRTLYQVKLDCEKGKSVQQALTGRRVWNNRMQLMQSALSRHSLDSLTGLLQQAARVDGSIKGFGSGKPWDHLETLVAELCATR
tara:strand:+ start:80789 stop:81799 length:1011 start_codon:yes stop_codon:yes gene_type:complete